MKKSRQKGRHDNLTEEMISENCFFFIPFSDYKIETGLLVWINKYINKVLYSIKEQSKAAPLGVESTTDRFWKFAFFAIKKRRKFYKFEQ